MVSPAKKMRTTGWRACLPVNCSLTQDYSKLHRHRHLLRPTPPHRHRHLLRNLHRHHPVLYPVNNLVNHPVNLLHPTPPHRHHRLLRNLHRHHPALYPVNNPVNPPVNNPVNLPVNHQVNNPVDHQVNNPVNNQVNHLANRQVYPLANHRVHHRVNHPPYLHHCRHHLHLLLNLPSLQPASRVAVWISRIVSIGAVLPTNPAPVATITTV